MLGIFFYLELDLNSLNLFHFSAFLKLGILLNLGFAMLASNLYLNIMLSRIYFRNIVNSVVIVYIVMYAQNPKVLSQFPLTYT